MTTILERGGTAAQWTVANPILAARQLGVETDTGKIKVGDGATAWVSLQYSAIPLDADLAAIAALSSAADKVPYSTGAQAWALADFTSTGRAMVAAASAAAQALLLGAEVYKQAQTINAQTGTTYTLVAGDAGKLVTLSNGSAITLTFPQDSDATIAVGAYGDLMQLGAGQVTAAAGSGATVRSSGLTLKARAQYSRLGWQKISANTFSFFGDIAAS